MEEQVDATNEELRPSFVCSHFVVKPMIQFNRFSKFERLKRCLAYVLRYVGNLRKTVHGSSRKLGRQLGREELQDAEKSLWILVQSESFPDEVAVMNHNKQHETKKKTLESSSKLAKLPPIIDDRGVPRVDGRIDAAEYLSFDAKFPIILPREHRVTELLLDWYHQKYRHANDETVLNEIRQRFYIVKLRTCLCKTKTRCIWCRVFKCTPVVPKMAPLPRVRLTEYLSFEYLSFDAKFPIILPREHRVTELLLDWYHQKNRHANYETVLNEIRQRFYIVKLRTCLCKTKTRCIWCRVYKCTPVVPKMAPLPRVRLTAYVRAFTFIGIDYFGPYLVKLGRSAVKRWGVVFTCLTIRAVHIEVARSLTADSCKKAIRRFIARRGAPQEIYSDNGTNFVGVSRELHNEIREISTELGSAFTDGYTQWRFNPPSAPHMGGCWERMVRSIKVALAAVPVDDKLDDESLETLFAEAEMMINSRPLTFVSLQTSDEEASTPNLFLLLCSTVVQQPIKSLVCDGKSVRNSWNSVQKTLDKIWQRWITEYLPMITRRTKWFQDVRPISEGALVIIADERIRNKWVRGRVVRTYPGKDGIVRQADVSTPSGVLRRAVAKLAILDIEPEDGGSTEDDARNQVRHAGEDVTSSKPLG
ncbi:uncharacterized protein LOC134292218 [Aedes albopictus]|uniref:Integrase catalytic domain-containing protein n=1 Tax=Aedes albopictus TaxID=7160 RepID=A0ABM1Z9G7_AEDAL